MTIDLFSYKATRKAFAPLLALLLGFAGFAATAMAQGNSPDDRNAQLLDKVKQLEAEIAAIKAELARPAQGDSGAPVSASPAQRAVPAPAVAPDTSTLPMDSSEGDAHTLGPWQFRGYSDFTFGRPIFSALPAGGLAGSNEAFSLGDFDLFVNARLSEHLSVLGELLITSDFSNEFTAEMDRLLLTYSANKYFKISAGKYHTAIGYYTNAFHRARYFQTATGVPILFTDEDDGGILPVHSIGVSATGEVPSGPLGLHWVAEVANGTGAPNSDTEPIHNFVDENNGKAYNLALYIQPEALRGLNIGGSVYHDLLHPAGLGSVQERIYSAHAAVVRPHLELIGEGVLLQHDFLLSARNVNTLSAYGQASYQVRRVRPYFRFDYQNVPMTDPIFSTLGRISGPSIGVRYDLTDFVSFKLQYGLLGVRSGPSTNDVQAQLVFAF